MATRRWLYHRSTAVALLTQTAWRADWMPKSLLVASTTTPRRIWLLGEDARHNPARPVRLSPLSCEQPKPHSEPERGINGQQIRTAAGSNGVLCAAGVGQGWEGVVQEQTEGWELRQVRWRWGA